MTRYSCWEHVSKVIRMELEEHDVLRKPYKDATIHLKKVATPQSCQFCPEQPVWTVSIEVRP